MIKIAPSKLYENKCMLLNDFTDKVKTINPLELYLMDDNIISTRNQRPNLTQFAYGKY